MAMRIGAAFTTSITIKLFSTCTGTVQGAGLALTLAPALAFKKVVEIQPRRLLLLPIVTSGGSS